MLKAEIKKIILTRLDEVLKPLGYIRRVTDGIRYLKATDQYIDSFCLIPLSDAIEGTGFYREHIEVANILFEVARNIQKPYIYIDEFRKIKFIFTICDYSVSSDWGYYGEDSFDLKRGNWGGIDAPEAANAYLDWYISYLLGEGLEFLNYYSYLPNVLKKMDELDKTNTYWGKEEVGILPWGAADFIGLVISKLCNDPKYEKKLERFNAYYSKGENEEDLPAFEKLKEILERVEPRYNV